MANMFVLVWLFLNVSFMAASANEGIFFKNFQSDVSLKQGESVTLACRAAGFPEPQVSFYHNGVKLSLKESDTNRQITNAGLTINRVSSADEGEYTCMAKNNHGVKMHKFTMTVKDASPEISDSLIDEAVKKAKASVNLAYYQQQQADYYSHPKTADDLIHKLYLPKSSMKVQHIGAEVYERALRIIFDNIGNITFNIDFKDFIGLQILNHPKLSVIAEKSGCVQTVKELNCDSKCLKYRSYDGSCNNLKRPYWGQTNTPFNRLLSAQYENGISTPRGFSPYVLHNGYYLPNVRQVSNNLLSTSHPDSDPTLSNMVMVWGQFLDHDMTSTATAVGKHQFSDGGKCKDTCSMEPPCFSIPILKGDTARPYDQIGKCIQFTRSASVCGTGETSLLTYEIHERAQINEINSYIDASNVYGSTVAEAEDLRRANSGFLQVQDYPDHGLKNYLPAKTKDGKFRNFKTGDARGSEHLSLLVLHAVMTRQHNKVAHKLIHLNKQWSQEKLFQETRKIIGAQVQIISEHFMTALVGPSWRAKVGKYYYDVNSNPTISTEFATAAFRYGHAQVQPFEFRLDEMFNVYKHGHLPLRKSLLNPKELLNSGMDIYLRGLYARPNKLFTNGLTTELTEHMFEKIRKIGLDLAAINIQRGRDHGLASYTDYRRFCGLPEVYSFDDLRNEFTDRQIYLLKKLYGSPKNIDLFAGGVLERPSSPDSRLGPVFQCIIIDQFKRVRNGDRFWYENNIFSPKQVEQLKKTTLGRIICDNGDNIKRISPNVFYNVDIPNGLIPCDETPSLDFTPWTEYPGYKDYNKECAAIKQ